jgi:aldehyde dehydrogenase (NAD+)
MNDTIEFSRELTDHHNLVAGQRAAAEPGVWLDSYDPYLGQPFARIPRRAAGGFEAAVAAARTAFYDSPWRDVTPTQRGKLLNNFAELVEENFERLGKLVAEMMAQARYVAKSYRYFGGYNRRGFGGEYGQEAMSEFLQTRTVRIETEPSTGNLLLMKLGK